MNTFVHWSAAPATTSAWRTNAATAWRRTMRRMPRGIGWLLNAASWASAGSTDHPEAFVAANLSA